MESQRHGYGQGRLPEGLAIPLSGPATPGEPFETKDGSLIRELAHPDAGQSRNQSLAEATVPPGGRTETHLHRLSEEIYRFTSGHGTMLLGSERFEVAAGDTVVIPPGTVHGLINGGEEPLVLLCCCSPPYSHEDTILAELPSRPKLG